MSLGPDGFALEFFRVCCDIIKTDLCRVLEEFHSNSKLMRGCNNPFIVLIPKKEGMRSWDNSGRYLLLGVFTKPLRKTLPIE